MWQSLYVFRCYLQCLSSGLEHMENLVLSQKRSEFEEEYGVHTYWQTQSKINDENILVIVITVAYYS
jgi:hypothetical protein